MLSFMYRPLKFLPAYYSNKEKKPYNPLVEIVQYFVIWIMCSFFKGYCALAFIFSPFFHHASFNPAKYGCIFMLLSRHCTCQFGRFVV